MGKHDRVENGLDLDEGAPASNSKNPFRSRCSASCA